MKKIVWVLAILAIGVPAAAKDIQITTDQLLQSEFDGFVKEFGAGISFNPMAPAEPLGMSGFDLAVEVVLTDIGDSKSYWTKMVSDNNPDSYLPVPRLHLSKGLPFRVDVGAFYSFAPGYDIQLWGLEAKYAILEGSVATPALSVRASYSRLGGVDDVDLSTGSVDLLISKGFAILTPYAGVSALWLSGSENTDLVDLDDVDESLFRGLLGLQISPFPLFVINAEVSLGDVTQYGLKIAIRF